MSFRANKLSDKPDCDDAAKVEGAFSNAELAARYNAAIQLHDHEFRALGERSNALLVTQSILIAAFVLILSNQNSFGYAFPYVLTGIGAVGTLFCVLHHISGHFGSRSAFTWKQYMRHLEQGLPTPPWQWYYEHCHDVEKHSASETDQSLLNRLPLPTTWLFTPLIFVLSWFGGSLYIPFRICFDSLFAENSNRALVLIVAGFFTLLSFASASFLVYRIKVWWFDWTLK